MDQRVKVRTENRKVIEMKRGSLEARMGRGEIKIQSSGMVLHRV